MASCPPTSTTRLTFPFRASIRQRSPTSPARTVSRAPPTPLPQSFPPQGKELYGALPSRLFQPQPGLRMIRVFPSPPRVELIAPQAPPLVRPPTSPTPHSPPTPTPQLIPSCPAIARLDRASGLPVVSPGESTALPQPLPRLGLYSAAPTPPPAPTFHHSSPLPRNIGSDQLATFPQCNSLTRVCALTIATRR